MTQISGNSVNPFGTSQTVRDLDDKSSYRVGRDGSLKKANTVGTFFKETFSGKTIRQQNQKAIDTLVRQMAQQYGNDIVSATRRSLDIPQSVLSGKRAITGKDLRAIADTIKLASAFNRQSQSIPLGNALKALMKTDAPTPQQILATMREKLPKDISPQGKQQIIQQAVFSLDQAQTQKLQTAMFGKEMNDVKALLGQAETWIKDNKDGALNDGQRAQNKLFVGTQTFPLQDIVNMTRDSLQVCGKMKDFAPPEPVTAKPCTWGNASGETLKLLEELGVPPRDTLLSIDLKDILPRQEVGGYFRKNEFSTKILRDMSANILRESASALMAKLGVRITEGLPELIKFLPPNIAPERFASILARGIRETPELRDKYEQILVDFMKETPGFKEALGECCALLGKHLHPFVKSRPDTAPENMRFAFNGLVSIGLTSMAVTDASAIKDNPYLALGYTIGSMLLQTALKPDNYVSGNPIGDFLQSIPGWKEMQNPGFNG